MADKAAIIRVKDVITDRERDLFKGNKEQRTYGPYAIVLYWEPHFEGELGTMTATKSFTIDVISPFADGNRYRFATLRAADRKIAEIEEQLIIELGKLAFRIN